MLDRRGRSLLGCHLPRPLRCLRAHVDAQLCRPPSASSPVPAKASHTNPASRRRGTAIRLTRRPRDEPPCAARGGTRSSPASSRSSTGDEARAVARLGRFAQELAGDVEQRAGVVDERAPGSTFSRRRERAGRQSSEHLMDVNYFCRSSIGALRPLRPREPEMMRSSTALGR